MRTLVITFALASVVAVVSRAQETNKLQDPLQPLLQKEAESSVATLIRYYRERRLYGVEDFPLPPERFTEFRQLVTNGLTHSLDLEDWVVRNPDGKGSPIQKLFRDHLVKTIEHHGISMEVHIIELLETGDRIPAVICLPEGSDWRPGIAVFSGHSQNGLRDLVIDLDSYQRGIATRLAQAGFVTIAVEKFDTGYLARTAPSGVDEKEIATFRLGMRKLSRSIQLMASLAAVEILAAHSRVDERLIGAAGVSLGGWLSVQAALLSDRIRAVADFGRKTVFVPDEMVAADFQGVTDLCHILPNMFEIGDRNLMTLAYAAKPLLAGHGREDSGSHEQADRYYRRPLEGQYEALREAGNHRYLVHDGGDTMPEEAVIEFFREQFER